MTTYRIEMMTSDDYCRYMGGSNECRLYEIDVDAETAEDAVMIAKRNNPEMVINEKYVKTIAEIEAQQVAWANARKADEERRAATRAKKAAKEQEKATALGLTVEEYREKIKYERRVKAAEKEVAELTKALEAAKKRLEKLL